MIDQLQERRQLEAADEVRRYVRGSLNDAEVAGFEARLMDSADLQDRVEAELALKEHAPAVISARHDSARYWLPLAACLVIGLATGYGVRPLISEQIGSGSHALVLVQMVSQRAAPEDAPSAPSGRAVALQFMTAFDAPHGIDILDRHGRRIVHERGVLPDASGRLLVWLPAMSADRGPLRIELSDGTHHQHFQLAIRP